MKQHRPTPRAKIVIVTNPRMHEYIVCKITDIGIVKYKTTTKEAICNYGFLSYMHKQPWMGGIKAPVGAVRIKRNPNRLVVDID